MTWERHEITDISKPTVDQMREILYAIDRAAGPIVYLHCWVGHGQTATVAGSKVEGKHVVQLNWTGAIGPVDIFRDGQLIRAGYDEVDTFIPLLPLRNLFRIM